MKTDWEKVIWKTPCGSCKKLGLMKVSRAKTVKGEKHIKAICSKCGEYQVVKYSPLTAVWIDRGILKDVAK